MVLTSAGEVLTNNHVIRGATTIKVVPGAGHSYPAKVVGYNVPADVTVLHATGATDLRTIAPDSSSRVKVGEAVAAFGNAGGTGSLTSSSGTVTALQRSITVSDDQGDSDALANLVETDAPAPARRLRRTGARRGRQRRRYGHRRLVLVQLLCSRGARDHAIPINRALAIAKQIASGEGSTTVHVGSTAFLGVATITPHAAGPDASTRSGATIAGIARGGPAAAAELAAGDSILAVEGRRVSTPTALGSLILSEKPGARVSVKYTNRSGASRTADVTLASGPPQ